MNTKSRAALIVLVMSLLAILIAPTAMAGDTFNLLTNNNDFDTIDLSWTVLNKTSDKIVCGDKAPDGTTGCAFRFKGRADEASKLKQTINGSGLVDFQGFIDDATVSVQMGYQVNSFSPATVLKAKTIVTLEGGTKVKSVANFSGTTMIGEFTSWQSVDGTTVNVPQGSNVTSVKVTFANKSTAGKAFIDDVNVYFASLAS